MGRLLVSVRGPREALAAAEGGASIADVEHPSSALGTPYPLNIQAVHERLKSEGFSLPISTNIGEEQRIRSSACQAALGVAIAGADYVKCGFAGMDLSAATYLGRNLTRTVRHSCPASQIFPAVFPEEEFTISFDPLTDGPSLVEEIDCDGLLIDTYRKDLGQGLLDYFDLEQLHQFVEDIHSLGKQAWLAGSISIEELPDLWKTGADVVCVRGAACETRRGEGRFGEVTASRVSELVATIP